MKAGTLIKRYRNAKDWTQDELAYEMGVSKAYISAVENDAKPLSLKQFLRFGSALGIPSREIEDVQHRKKKLVQSADGEFDEILKAKDNLDRFLAEIGMSTDSSEIQMLPLVGEIPAGTPLLNFADAQDLATERIPVLKRNIGHSECFFLKVRGDSMIDAGIEPDDLILIDPEDTEISGIGRVMAVFIDDEITLKTVVRLSARSIRLVPENSRYAYMEVDLNKKRVRIIGVVLPYMIRFNKNL